MNGKDPIKNSAPPEPEFSRTVKVSAIDSAPALTFEARPEERALLAERFGLISVGGLSLEVALEKWRNGVRVSGQITAEVVQRSVVSLDPVTQAVSESFVRGFLPDVEKMDDMKPGAEIEMPFDAELDDAPEPLSDQIDVGELASEALGLALDPYPRGEAEEYSDRIAGPPDTKAMTDDDAKPFASLAEYREKMVKGD